VKIDQRVVWVFLGMLGLVFVVTMRIVLRY
jgi:hypothetical protein